MMNRRELAKGIAAGLTLAATEISAEAATPHAAGTSVWKPVLPGIWRATVGVPEAQTPARCRLIAPTEAALHAMPSAHRPDLALTSSMDARGVHLNLPLAPGELIYGFGLQLMSFEQRTKKRTIRVNADPLGDSGDSHAPVPFYLTTHGYGVLVDTFRQANFYCGQVQPKPTKSEPVTSLTVNVPTDVRARQRELQAEMRIEVPRCKGVDVYLFSGPSMMDVVRRYNLFSGGGVTPPTWGLGFWYRPEMHLDADQITKLEQEFRDRKIPCDVFGLEPGWQTHAYSCSFAWEKARFPDPKAFVQKSGEMGFHINLWEHAFTHPSSPIFPALVPYAGNYAVWEGLVPDFAGAPARKIFGGYHAKELIDIGISGFKLDECDGSDFTNGWSFADFSRFPSGLDGEQMHACFGLRYQDTILNAFQSRNKSTYGLVRSSGTFAAPYPFVLYSDLYDHRQFIRALVNSGFCGLLWCPEVRDAHTEEDLLRRLQSVIFSPLAMVNAWYIRNPPWKQIDRTKNNNDEFTHDWEALETKCREIIGWRMQMLPYLEAAFAKYAKDGTPPFRALLLDFPEDASLTNVDDQYMMGDSLMIAPMFAKEAGRNVVFPAGEWHDFWTGERITGPTKKHIPATYNAIPVYVRSGSVIPWAEVTPTTQEKQVHVDVRVYGDGSRSWQSDAFALTWDATASSGHAAAGATQSSRYIIRDWKKIG
ncbi:MAG: glycoside hydrolase [Acidobacteria bacterium]|nr:glycoside hydrolase [Acidobacteriota bacterium]